MCVFWVFDQMRPIYKVTWAISNNWAWNVEHLSILTIFEYQFKFHDIKMWFLLLQLSYFMHQLSRYGIKLYRSMAFVYLSNASVHFYMCILFLKWCLPRIQFRWANDPEYSIRLEKTNFDFFKPFWICYMNDASLWNVWRNACFDLKKIPIFVTKQAFFWDFHIVVPCRKCNTAWKH